MTKENVYKDEPLALDDDIARVIHDRQMPRMDNSARSQILTVAALARYKEKPTGAVLLRRRWRAFAAAAVLVVGLTAWLWVEFSLGPTEGSGLETATMRPALLGLDDPLLAKVDAKLERASRDTSELFDSPFASRRIQTYRYGSLLQKAYRLRNEIMDERAEEESSKESRLVVPLKEQICEEVA